jgi:pyruvate/2-oxoglutarate dehydrogenase complex dihydrolipoamide dehydrogenase (E3) component
MSHDNGELRPEICVIGAGPGGLSVAAAAATFDFSSGLIEKGPMGSESLNRGSVPAQALMRWPYRENDRAQVERATEGHIKVVTDCNGEILGVTIVGSHAAESIAPWTLAISEN